jgi:hypothetical protein
MRSRLWSIALASVASLLCIAWLITADYRRIGNLSNSGPIGWLALIAAAYVLILCLLFPAEKRVAGLFSAIVGGGMLVILVSSIVIAAVISPMFVGAIYVFGGLVGPTIMAWMIAQSILVIAGLGVARGWTTTPRLMPSVTGVIVTTAALATASNVWHYRQSPEHAQAVRQDDRIAARNALTRIQRCLDELAQKGGNYPATLDAIGPNGTRCVSDEVARNKVSGYTFDYASQGGAYTIALNSTDPRARYDSVTSDETGVLFSGSNLQDSNAAPLLWIGSIDACTEVYRRFYPNRGYPPTLAAMDTPGFACLNGGTVVGERYDALKRGRYEGFRYIYTPGLPDATGKITTFRLDVRPVKYGHGVTRSYMCDPRGELRATEEDRPAEHTDRNSERNETLEVDRPHYCVGRKRPGS